MNQTLILNALIVLAVCFTVFTEHNPMAVLALMYLQQLPTEAAQRFFMPPGMGGDDDDDTKPIGFTADIH